MCTDWGSHHMQISDAIASTPDPNQLKNHTYLMESFENLVASLGGTLRSELSCL